MKNKIITGAAIVLTALYLLPSCSSIPGNADPVENFEVDRYLGTWYEIARFDHRFERDMDNVSARYSLKENGEIKVFNSGYNYKKQEWKSATGSAGFRKGKSTAALKVTFFKPFYSGYNVVAIDKDYQYALVAGRNLEYLWLLSRKKTMPEPVRQEYLKKAEEIGYDTSNLIWVTQDRNNPLINEE